MPTVSHSGALARTREFIRGELADGPKLRLPLYRTAMAQGYVASNLDLAAKQLGIISDRVRIDGEGWRARWALPPENIAGRSPVNPPPDTPTMTTDEAPTEISQQLATIQSLNRLVDIYRLEDGELAFLDSQPGTECTLRQIKRRYGGGDYKIEGVRVRISGAAVIPDGVDAQLRPRGSTVAAPAPAPAGGLDLGMLVVKMIEQQGQLLTAILTKGNATTTDPVAMFTAVDNAVARRLEAGPAQAPTPVEEALKLLREGMAIGRDSEGGDPGDANFGKIMSQVAPFLNALALRIAPQPGAPVPAAQPSTSEGRIVLLPTDQPAMPVNAIQRVLADLAPSLPDLLNEAKRGRKADETADYIHDHTTDAQYDALAEAADAGHFVEALMEGLAPHLAAAKAGWAVPWMRQVAESLNGLLAADREHDGDNDSGVADGPTVPGAAGAGRAASPDR